MALADLALAFTLGTFASANPCVLPLYPGFLAYMASRSREMGKTPHEGLMGLLVLAGVLTMMLLLGLAISLIGVSTSDVLKIVTPVADVMLILIGLVLLLNIDIGSRIPQLRAPLTKDPLRGSFVYGLLYGPIVLPCNAPLFLAVFTRSVGVEDFFGRLGIVLAFGLGFGLPLLLISLLGKARQGWLVRMFAENHSNINRVAGVILIAVGLYDLYLTTFYLSVLLANPAMPT
ncbi:MAG: cytochrome C biogenesis protein [Candidatus Aenigmatarchaeota archaeon]|nr:MAG: cytochrome C biogenesis protein [Candidatus Aenigmarchaeota archaeon]